ncbi:MAG: rRNA maturation RNase YbeY [Verrucomicrobiales bacterium]|nr:rRNA maturation RNase YbeY [Verrucomicrobiales bacterium]
MSAGSAASGRPVLSVHALEQVEERAPEVEWLKRALEGAMPACLQVGRGGEEDVLARLPEVEVTLMDDATIAVAHAEFLDDPTPTDVITFFHGEILISVETAEREARQRGLPLAQEVLLYGIHGLLHLAGWDDHEPQEAAAMAERQEAILAEVWADSPAIEG